MRTAIEEIESFLDFARKTAVGREDGPTLEDCLRLWREEQELAETVAAIRRGEENFAAGRCMSLEEAERRIHTELGATADDA